MMVGGVSLGESRGGVGLIYPCQASERDRGTRATTISSTSTSLPPVSYRLIYLGMTARQARAGWRGASWETGTSRRKPPLGSALVLVLAVLLAIQSARQRAEGAKRYLHDA